MKREISPISVNRQSIDLDKRLTEVGQGLHIGMYGNGHIQEPSGRWLFDTEGVGTMVDRYRNQNVSFFGPGGGYGFYSITKTDPSWFLNSFQQAGVADTLHKIHGNNPYLATRISFLMGGLIREQLMSPYNFQGTKSLPEKVAFTARMTRLAEEKSAEAVTSIAAMYALSGGEIHQVKEFDRDIYHMAEAFVDDPIEIKQTRDLGLSQVARLRSFLGKLSEEEEYFPYLDKELDAFEGFPTVGAEFHFTPKAIREVPDLWRRLAVLNLSQYHTNSAIQLSRNDQDVIEVRMNPSVYPVTIANWNYMRLLLPELNHTTFTITLNRDNVQGDFTWQNKADERVLRTLKGLALLNYVRYFNQEPCNARDGQIQFGSSYLGQTVDVKDGEFDYRGSWKGGKGSDGQIGIFAGIGDNLPDLAYYLSMALRKPEIAHRSSGIELLHIHRLKDAFEMGSTARKQVFNEINDHIAQDSDLSNAAENGNEIMAKLNP